MIEGRYHHLMLTVPDETLTKKIPFELSECKSDKDIVLREISMFLALRKLYFKLFPHYFNESLGNRFKGFHNSHESAYINENSIVTLEGRILHQCHLVKNNQKRVV